MGNLVSISIDENSISADMVGAAWVSDEGLEKAAFANGPMATNNIPATNCCQKTYC